uniref:(northern house mosquito) hypothetical protein n=1 Tax=Culex pipiens TaxID=7175 RepID=A0A8D8B0Q6_CULPI
MPLYDGAVSGDWSSVVDHRFRYLYLDVRTVSGRGLFRRTVSPDCERRFGGPQAGSLHRRRQVFAGVDHAGGNRDFGSDFWRFERFTKSVNYEHDRGDAVVEQADLCAEYGQRGDNLHRRHFGRTDFPGRTRRLSVRDFLPGRIELVWEALQEGQSLAGTDVAFGARDFQGVF